MDVWEMIRVRCLRDPEPYKRSPRTRDIEKHRQEIQCSRSVRPQMQRSQHASRLDAHRPQIDKWLRANPRTTATRIGALLRERYDPDLRIRRDLLPFYATRNLRKPVVTGFALRSRLRDVVRKRLITLHRCPTMGGAWRSERAPPTSSRFGKRSTAVSIVRISFGARIACLFSASRFIGQVYSPHA